MTIHSIGIVGFGRFGRVLHRLFQNKFEVYVSSSSRGSEEVDGIRFRTLEETVYLCDALFLAVPIRSIRETARKIKPFLCPGHLVVDVCSVKEVPFSELTAELQGMGVHIWPTHPMFGPYSAKDGFRGLKWVSCEESIDPTVIAPLISHLEAEGLTIFRTDCESHDRTAARTQGLTHLIGRVMGELALAETPIDTVGFKRLIAIRDQICTDSMELFFDLMKYNRFSDEVQKAFETAVGTVLSRLSDNSRESVVPKHVESETSAENGNGKLT